MASQWSKRTPHRCEWPVGGGYDTVLLVIARGIVSQFEDIGSKVY